ncbi:hypothetical protein PENSPDRAFT_690650 [Peniophora sp. CONT]|nr:hypothetical protein PENSPDRAFT_690650 [Peniophora sp. CONT]
MNISETFPTCQALLAQIRSEEPQLARFYLSSPDKVPASREKQASKKAPRSKGRARRKAGRAEQDARSERERLERIGFIRDYNLTLVRREAGPDVMVTSARSAQDLQLWDQLRDVHLQFSTTYGEHRAAHQAYFDYLKERMSNVELHALAFAQNKSARSRALDRAFHGYRREIGILHQEMELLTLDTRQLRAVAMDDAFLARGRRLKQRSFRAVLGWWSMSDLLHKHGISVTSSEDTASDGDGSDAGARFAVTCADADGDDAREGSDAETRQGASDTDLDLFASGAEDDWSADELLA